MKKYIQIILIILILLNFSILSLGARLNFPDVQPEHWFYKPVMDLVNRGAIKGYPDGSFRPYDKITFAEFLKLAMAATTGKDPQAREGEHWATGVYRLALEENIISSKEFGGEYFDKPITREDMTSIILNIELNIFYGRETSNIVKGIGDMDLVSENRKDQVLQAYSLGLIGSKGDGKFDPQGKTNRAEAATVLIRLLDKGQRLEPKELVNPTKARIRYVYPE